MPSAFSLPDPFFREARTTANRVCERTALWFTSVVNLSQCFTTVCAGVLE